MRCGAHRERPRQLDGNLRLFVKSSIRAINARLVTISAADPLHLTGIVTAGERIRAAGRNRIVYRDGVPLSVRDGDLARAPVALRT